jgi:hypothetical protein
MSSAAALAGTAHVTDGRSVDDAGLHERLALHRSLLLRRRAWGWYVLVTDQRVVVNAAAHRLITPDDEPAIRMAADQLRARRRGDVLTLQLRSGAVSVRAEPVPDHESAVGIVLQLRPITRGVATSRTQPQGT